MGVIDDDFSIVNSLMPVWTSCRQVDPGWLYILRSQDLLKVGRTTDPRRRLREARTWLPDVVVEGVKPFWHVREFERTLLCGLAQFWHRGEWHFSRVLDDLNFVVEGFQMFDDHDRARNTVDFSYWIGGSGMGELACEQNSRQISLRQWQREA